MYSFISVCHGISLLSIPFNNGNYSVSVVLVRCGGQTVLIDSGECAQTVDNYILPALHEIGVDRLDWLLCTHQHSDHIGGHKRLRKILGCPIAVYEKDADSFPAPVDRILHDEEMPVQGLQLIATPGHSNDSVCFLHCNSKTLITGDSFQGCGTDGVGLALVEDIQAYQTSIQRIISLKAQRIIAGHCFSPCDSIISIPMHVHAFLQCCTDTIDRYLYFVSNHEQLDDYSLAELLKEKEGRIQNYYLTPCDGTIHSCRIFLKNSAHI